MEPSTSQQKPPEKQKSTTNTLLNLLSRRSTKVEPSPSIENNINSTSSPTCAAATSAHSSPISTINQFRQGHLRRHSSTQNISSIRRDESASPIHNVKRTVGGIPKKAKSSPSTNRFSHQFTLCCSVHDDRMCTPPVSVRYNSLAQVELRNTINGPSQETQIIPIENGFSYGTHNTETIPRKPNGHVPLASSSISVTTATVHTNQQDSLQIPGKTSLDNLPITHAVSTDDSSNDDSADKPVVFNEYQSSIAMSACRSRLRERLLPPAGHLVRSLDLPNSPPITTEQHFSSPNICTIASNESSPAREKPTTISALTTNQNRSLSYDVLTGVRRPASADSLAKQSLIAAQLLNLIPAERARER